jgi:hypothetical protein
MDIEEKKECSSKLLLFNIPCSFSSVCGGPQLSQKVLGGNTTVFRIPKRILQDFW